MKPARLRPPANRGLENIAQELFVKLSTNSEHQSSLEECSGFLTLLRLPGDTISFVVGALPEGTRREDYKFTAESAINWFARNSQAWSNHEAVGDDESRKDKVGAIRFADHVGGLAVVGVPSRYAELLALGIVVRANFLTRARAVHLLEKTRNPHRTAFPVLVPDPEQLVA